MKLHVHELPSGQIFTTGINPRYKRPDEKETEFTERVLAKVRNEEIHRGATRLADCEESNLPTMHFRNCWRNAGDGTLPVNMPLASEQLMAEIRAERDKRLTATDAEKARLDDVGTVAQQNALAAKRQALRDIPQGFDLDIITSPEELEVFEPEWPELS